MQSTLLHVLLIDDGDMDSVISQGLLVNNPIVKIQIARAITLDAAMAHVECQPTDVILLNVSDSPGTSLKSLEELQRRAPAVPVVVMLADMEAQTGLRAIQLGAQDIVSKNSFSGSQLVCSLMFAFARQSKLLGLRDAAHIDQLTGLSNRRCFIETFDGFVNSERVVERTYCLALLDVDHFKWFNDQHGHVGGDLALKHLGALLRRELAEEDLVFRYGGEEFAILIDLPLDQTRNRLESLLKSLESEAFEVQSQSVRVTASVGLTQLVCGESYQQALQRCDEALYSAKAGGRNQVTLADHLVAQPRMHSRSAGHRLSEAAGKRRQIGV